MNIIELYQKANLSVPVKDFLDGLDLRMRAKAIHEIELLEKFGLQLREPHVKVMKGRKYKAL